MKIWFMAISSLLIAFTALPLLRKEAWWIRIFDFPRLQLAILIAAALIAHLILFFSWEGGRAQHLFLFALAACLTYQCYMMYPYTPLARRQVRQSARPRRETSLALAFANVLMENRRAEKLKTIFREADPDVILVVEADAWWAEQLAEFEKTHPHYVRQPQDNTYGMLLYSRFELLSPEVKFLVQKDVPSIHGRVKLPSGDAVELRCLHPRPPFPTEDERSTERDVELVIVGKEAKELQRPIVVLGDLNDVAWSRTTNLFQKISNLLDPRIGRGFYHTFHAKYPFIKFPLDHFFHSNHFKLVEFKRLAAFGSDHFPVFIKLSFEPEAAREQEKPQADQAERREADEKIERAGVKR